MFPVMSLINHPQAVLHTVNKNRQISLGLCHLSLLLGLKLYYTHIIRNKVNNCKMQVVCIETSSPRISPLCYCHVVGWISLFQVANYGSLTSQTANSKPALLSHGLSQATIPSPLSLP